MLFAKKFLQKKIELLLAAFFLSGVFCPAALFSQENSGAVLSDAVFNALKRGGFAPQKESLSSAFFADFPCNVSVEFKAASEAGGWTFFLLSPQEDFFESQKFFMDLLAYLKAADFPYSVKAVFTAGDRKKIEGNESMAGTELFAKSVEGSQNAAALLLSFSARRKNHILPGSSGKLSPYYLVRLLNDSLEKNSCPNSISGGVFLSLYRTKLFKEDPSLASFLTRQIPALSLKLVSSHEQREEQLNSVKDFFAEIDLDKCGVWSQHYATITFFSKRLWLEEKSIIYSVMTFMALTMFILSDFAFIFRRRTKRLVVIKRRALKSNYLILATVLATALAFTLGEAIARLIQNLGLRNAMVLFPIKLAPAFLLVSSVYPLELKRRSHLSTYHYEYVLSISAILNIFIFSLFDISFFFLFALEYLILALSRAFKSRLSLFIFIALFITPFLPVMLAILVYSDIKKIYGLIFCGFSKNLLLAFILVPFNLLWLRILARLNVKAKTDKQRLFGYVVTSVSCFAALALFSAAVIFALTKIFFATVEPSPRMARVYNQQGTPLASVQVYDTEYYGGKVRRIEIDSSKNAERYSIFVNGKSGNPVYFSVYDTRSNGRSTEFLLPDNPPRKLNVIYTPDMHSEQDIVVSAYYMDGQSDGRSAFCETHVFEARDGQINRRTAENEF